MGIPLALEKVEGPSTTLPFLGITLDTIKMEARLPEDKLSRLKEEFAQWITRKKAKKREILTIVGSLQHAAKVVRWGRAFLSWMYATAAKTKEMHYFTKLDVQFRSDICWWHAFLTKWNGVNLLRWDDDNWTPNIAFKQMPPGPGVVEPFGTTTGCNGVGHRNGPTIILWLRS